MKQSLFFVLLVLSFSCTPEKQVDTTLNQEDSANGIAADDTTVIGRPTQEISNKVFGEWINTSLFDSTLEQKKLEPWLQEFYGDLTLIISKTDSFTISGNMDGGVVELTSDDEFHFATSDLSTKPTFIYLPERDLILQKSNDHTVLFRRVRKSDAKQIIGNEENFNKYFINKFFIDNFFKEKKKPEFVEIWNGFQT